jgi:hypothetical protein
MQFLHENFIVGKRSKLLHVFEVYCTTKPSTDETEKKLFHGKQITIYHKINKKN